MPVQMAGGTAMFAGPGLNGRRHGLWAIMRCRSPDHRNGYPHASADTLPPIALVLTGAGPRGLDNLTGKVRDLTEEFWKPESAWRPYDFADRIPILTVRLDQLQQHGPQAPIWLRYGSEDLQTLTDALANRDYLQRTRARLAAQAQTAKAAEAEKERQENEARRCPTCNRTPDQYENNWDASNGTTKCGLCIAEEEAQELREAESRPRCTTCETGLLENSLLEHDPEAVECWKCYQKREFSGRPPLRRPEPKKKRRFFG
ncbi:hypothetical protein ABZW30_45525 [Kitasatospora sp. NPDC004669]|uniref:hypothetical protein n=1 Tax=Kitasatospora sp. NPDC004669 TaxID=3154555 RepID=UPI0033AB6B26